MTTAEEHGAAVARAVAAEPHSGGDRPEVVGVLQRLCRAAARDLPASGVGVSLLTEGGDVMTAAASSPVSQVVEELQFTFGEGPCIAAFASRLPVLVPDLVQAAHTTWPAYGPAALEQGVRAVFAFPLKVGLARLGVMDVYRERVGRLSSWTVSRALTYADAATRTMVDSEQSPREMAALLADSSVGRLEVYQAQGMVMVQLGISAADALLRIRAYAFLEGVAISQVAADIIERRLQLEPDGGEQ